MGFSGFSWPDKLFRLAVAMILLGIIASMGGLIFGFPVKWLWNGLMPQLFGLQKITFWQAWGLLLLCGLLFKGSNSCSTESE